MIPRPDGSVPTTKYEDPDLYFPLFTALQVNLKFHLSRHRQQIELFEKIQIVILSRRRPCT